MTDLACFGAGSNGDGDGDLTAIGSDGQKYLVVRRVCEQFGLDPKTQQRRIRYSGEFGEVNLTLPDRRGHPQSMMVIPIGRVPLWLYRIKYVRPELREQFDRFRMRFVDFVERKVEQDLGESDPVIRSFREMIEFRRAQLELQGRVDDHQFRLMQLKREIEIAEAKLLERHEQTEREIRKVHQEVTLQDTAFHLVPWAETQGIHLNKSQESIEGKRCTVISRSMGYEPAKRRTSKYPDGVNIYEESVLHAWKADYKQRSGVHCR